MSKIRFRVYEIEHEGDLNDARWAITMAGGTVLDTVPDFDSESAMITVELPDALDKDVFMVKAARGGLVR